MGVKIMVRWLIALFLVVFLASPAGAAPTLRTTQGVAIKKEIECLALNVYFEARSEPERGQLAVAHVVMNRVDDPRFPGSVCGTIRQGGETRNKCQFSWWCDGRSDRPRNGQAWKRARTIAQDVYFDQAADPTRGALWYHAHYVAPKWSRSLIQGPIIGQHVFYSDAAAARTQTARRARPDVPVKMMPSPVRWERVKAGPLAGQLTTQQTREREWAFIVFVGG